MLAAFSAGFALSPEEVQPAGAEWAFERGTYTITLTPKTGGDPIRDVGKYITLYQRQADGSWRMARDIWNSNNPPPPVLRKSGEERQHCRPLREVATAGRLGRGADRAFMR